MEMKQCKPACIRSFYRFIKINYTSSKDPGMAQNWFHAITKKCIFKGFSPFQISKLLAEVFGLSVVVELYPIISFMYYYFLLPFQLIGKPLICRPVMKITFSSPGFMIFIFSQLTRDPWPVPMLRKSAIQAIWLKIFNELSAHAQKIGPGQNM